MNTPKDVVEAKEANDRDQRPLDHKDMRGNQHIPIQEIRG